MLKAPVVSTGGTTNGEKCINYNNVLGETSANKEKVVKQLVWPCMDRQD
jgi:hypothetical protein